MRIRAAGKADQAALLGMVQALTRHHADEPLVTEASLTRDFFGPEPWFRVLVAEGEAGLPGYAATLPLARLGYGARGLDLHHLFVTEGSRGQGVGRALVQACEVMARDLGCSYLIIGTHPDNSAAQACYQALGYAQMPTTAVRFTKVLD
jgi:GNAT superfamily N-acetyltransferase